MDTLWALSMFGAVVVGTFTGSLHDPAFYLFLAVAIACGASPMRWWWLPPLAIILAVMRAGLAYQRYASPLGDTASAQLQASATAQSAMFLIIILIVRGISRLFRR